MKITKRNNPFSQFSNELWLTAEHDGTTISFDIDEKDLLTFANHLIDVAIDCLRKSSHDTDETDTILCTAMDEITKINKELTPSKTNPFC